MNRRDTVAALLALGTASRPFALFAQQSSGTNHRIGFLGATSAAGRTTHIEAFRAGLRDFGYLEGRDITIEYRWADDQYERLPNLAAELVHLKVEVIVTHATAGTRAAMAATKTIPIVMASSGDAVVLGLVASLARSGNNVTGSTFFNSEYAVKRLELLKEAYPRIARVGLLVKPDNATALPMIEAMAVSAGSMKVDFRKFEMRRPDEIKSVFEKMGKSHIEAVSVQPDAVFVANAKAIADQATKMRMISAGSKEFADAGGLIGYGEDNLALYRRAAYFVDKILKGSKPNDLPIEQPTRFELVINLKTAKALGLKIPQILLLRADKVIE